MSIRSIIEINHDALNDLIHRDADQLRAWLGLLACQTPPVGPTPVAGIRFLGQRHHTETLDLRVE